MLLGTQFVFLFLFLLYIQRNTSNLGYEHLRIPLLHSIYEFFILCCVAMEMNTSLEIFLRSHLVY
jgi:hypothetical protein